MLTEECQMNPYLIDRGIDVVETDLGERIIQLLGQKPSHIVMPAIHLTREEVGRMFEEKGISQEKGNYDPTYLTRCARHHLREEFVEADAGMTGCNFGVAKTGDIVVCTNEGNADMTTSIPKLHIVSMGIEKLQQVDNLIVRRNVSLGRSRQTKFSYTVTTVMYAHHMGETTRQRGDFEYVMQELYNVHYLL